eukprot:GHVQ01004491.1.p1 GENE.GHVQ01004491.1~~GHVQ01004491.1.p1  ORF type:complete len:599 (+),score=56.98 GHVQ01004491.1:219-2015(+)
MISNFHVSPFSECLSPRPLFRKLARHGDACLSSLVKPRLRVSVLSTTKLTCSSHPDLFVHSSPPSNRHTTSPSCSIFPSPAFFASVPSVAEPHVSENLSFPSLAHDQSQNEGNQSPLRGHSRFRCLGDSPATTDKRYDHRHSLRSLHMQRVSLWSRRYGWGPRLRSFVRHQVRTNWLLKELGMRDGNCSIRSYTPEGKRNDPALVALQCFEMKVISKALNTLAMEGTVNGNFQSFCRCVVALRFTSRSRKCRRKHVVSPSRRSSPIPSAQVAQTTMRRTQRDFSGRRTGRRESYAPLGTCRSQSTWTTMDRRIRVMKSRTAGVDDLCFWLKVGHLHTTRDSIILGQLTGRLAPLIPNATKNQVLKVCRVYSEIGVLSLPVIEQAADRLTEHLSARRVKLSDSERLVIVKCLARQRYVRDDLLSLLRLHQAANANHIPAKLLFWLACLSRCRSQALPLTHSYGTQQHGDVEYGRRSSRVEESDESLRKTGFGEAESCTGSVGGWDGVVSYDFAESLRPGDFSCLDLNTLTMYVHGLFLGNAEMRMKGEIVSAVDAMAPRIFAMSLDDFAKNPSLRRRILLVRSCLRYLQRNDVYAKIDR